MAYFRAENSGCATAHKDGSGLKSTPYFHKLQALIEQEGKAIVDKVSRGYGQCRSSGNRVQLKIITRIGPKKGNMSAPFRFCPVYMLLFFFFDPHSFIHSFIRPVNHILGSLIFSSIHSFLN